MNEKRELEIKIKNIRNRIEYWESVTTGSPTMKACLLRSLRSSLNESKARYAEFIGK